jgi:hypothetical protein
MMRSCWLVAGLLGLALMASSARAETRNPFGVGDVENPLGEDIQKFAKGNWLSVGKDDRNAKQWVTTETEGKSGSLDGAWSGRWEEGMGTAKVKTVKDRVFVLYTDHEGRLSGYTWLLEAARKGNRLLGRWAQVGNPNDTGAFVGLIVDDERIDGAWISTNSRPADQEVFAPNTRWDFRRKLKK